MLATIFMPVEVNGVQIENKESENEEDED
jgi:hypothetical protein